MILWITLICLCQTISVHTSGVRVVGGYEPIPNSSPSIAHLDRLGTSDGFFCCGSLVNTLWVVSAAHCRFDPNTNPFKVVLGDHNRYIDEGTEQERQVILALNHPLYNPEITDNDIMMLKIAYVQVIGLPDPSNTLGEGIECRACGWGYTDYVGSTLPHTLQCAEAMTMTNEQCNAKYYGEIKSSMLCAASDAHDACNGDSGGPLTCQGVLHGITSTGFGCGYPNFPGIYVRVTEFVDWMDSIITYF